MIVAVAALRQPELSITGAGSDDGRSMATPQRNCCGLIACLQVVFFRVKSSASTSINCFFTGGELFLRADRAWSLIEPGHCIPYLPEEL
jgi:hypothetical protein